MTDLSLSSSRPLPSFCSSSGRTECGTSSSFWREICWGTRRRPPRRAPPLPPPPHPSLPHPSLPHPSLPHPSPPPPPAQPPFPWQPGRGRSLRLPGVRGRRRRGRPGSGRAGSVGGWRRRSRPWRWDPGGTLWLVGRRSRGGASQWVDRVDMSAGWAFTLTAMIIIIDRRN